MSAPPPALRLSLQFVDPRHADLLPRHRVRRWLLAALDRPGEITVRLVGRAEGRRLNRDFRGKDYATNVLTFAYRHDAVIQADLVLCSPVLAEEARAQRIELTAHYAHLLVHGALHAQGHDHERPADARRMQAIETRLLLALGIGDPYTA